MAEHEVFAQNPTLAVKINTEAFRRVGKQLRIAGKDGRRYWASAVELPNLGGVVVYIHGIVLASLPQEPD